MSWLPERAEGATPFEAIFRLRPELHDAWSDFASIFWRERLVDPVILECCRLHVARLLGARWPQATRTPEAAEAGLDEAKIAALPEWWKSDRFSEAERACLAFAEQFALDPGGIGDAQAAAVVAALGDAGTVAFVEALAIFDGFARFCEMLGIVPEGAAAGDAPWP